MKFFIPFLLFCLGLLPCQAQQPPESGGSASPIEITSDGENHFDGKTATAQDNVIIRSGEDVAYADHLMYNAETKVAILTGNVRIYSGNQFYRGHTILFNFETKELTSADFRLSDYPSFVAGENVESPGLNHYRLHKGFFTTENREDPAWRVRANTIEIYPGNRVEMKNLVLYIGPVPVLWLPFFVQSLEDDQPGYDVAFGQSSRMGVYALNSFNFVPAQYLRGSIQFDARSKRGFAGGTILRYQKDSRNKFIFRGYYAQDNLYSNSSKNPAENPADADSSYRYGGVGTDSRYRLSYKQRIDFGPGLMAQADINRWSDPFVTLDFFEKEFREEVQPDNYLNFVQRTPNFMFSFFGRAQVNKFFETVARLPEARLDIRRQKIFQSPVEYVGRTSIVNFQRKFASTFEPGVSEPPDYSAWRYDTFHEFLYPNQYFDWLNFTPRLGLRYTRWSDSNEVIGDRNQSGQLIKNPKNRFLTNIGAEMSFKASKAWVNIQDKDWGIYGLRHVVEPFVNANYIPTVVGAEPDEIRGFDDRLPSDRLQPLTFPSFNSVDSIGHLAVIRHGVRNRLQTRRDGRNINLLEWSLYSDLDLDKNFSVFNNSLYSNLFSDFRAYPLPWLGFRSYASVDITGNSYNEFNNTLTWQVIPALEISAGNRFIDNSILFPNSNFLTFRTFYRMNEHWQLASYHLYDSESGDLQEQTYTVYRDLSAWQLSFSFSDRKINNNNNETVFFFTLTLKAFPALSLSTNSLQ